MKEIAKENAIRMNNKELEQMTDNILISMQSNRPNKSTFSKLQDYKSVKDILEEKHSELETRQSKINKEAEKINTELKMQQLFIIKSSNERNTAVRQRIASSPDFRTL